MLIVISPEEMLDNEAAIVNTMFDMGLEKYHIRKPDATELAIANLIEELNVNNYPKVVLHQKYQFALSHGVMGIHIPQYQRDLLDHEAFRSKVKVYKDYGYSVSTSIHSKDEIEDLDDLNYLLISPVFDSISKKGYLQNEKLKSISNVESERVVALGGVSESNLEELRTYGYQHAAVLGAIWQSEDPISAFQNIKDKWNQSALQS